MFWLPWAMALLFRQSGGGLGPGSFPRMLGMHLMASLLLSAAWLLLNSAHTLLHPSDMARQISLRRQCILGAAGAGLFYLLYPLVTDSPWVIALVVVTAAGILVALTVRGRQRSVEDDTSWMDS